MLIFRHIKAGLMSLRNKHQKLPVIPKRLLLLFFSTVCPVCFQGLWHLVPSTNNLKPKVEIFFGNGDMGSVRRGRGHSLHTAVCSQQKMSYTAVKIMAWTMLDSFYVRLQIFVWVTEKKSKYISAVIKQYNYFSFLSWKNSMLDLRKFRHRKTTWLQNVHTTKSHSKKQLVDPNFIIPLGFPYCNFYKEEKGSHS